MFLSSSIKRILIERSYRIIYFALLFCSNFDSRISGKPINKA